MIRLFIGIKIKNSTLDTIYRELHDQLSLSSIKWMDPNKYHLTLKFLGNTEETNLNGISLCLRNAADTNSSFTLRSNKTGFFGTSESPRVLWLDFHEHQSLNYLHKSIENNLYELGIEREERSFKPHLTLGRVKMIHQAQIVPIIKNFKAPKFSQDISSFSLIQSILKPAGPEYLEIQSFRLKKSIEDT